MDDWIEKSVMGVNFGACALCAGATAFHMLCLTIYSLPIENPAKKPLMKFISKSKAISLFFSLTLVPVFLSLLTICVYHSYLLFEAFYTQIPPQTISCLLALASFYNLMLMWVTRSHYILLVKDVDAVMTLEGNSAVQDLLAWEPPSKSFFDRLVAPGRMFLDYEVHGIKNIPTKNKKLLFVSNHSLAGVEMPLFIHSIYSNTGVFPRGLSDHFHFAIPFWGDVLKFAGGVDGTREVCTALMKNGDPILVYPGGGHEVLKKKTDKKYGLMWKKRAGFAKLAVQHGYTLVPCCGVGTEDMLETLVDIPADWLRKDLSFPLLKPVNPSKIQKVYFWFGEPVETEHLQDQWEDDEVVWKVREETRRRIEDGIQEMLQIQEKDPNRKLQSRLLNEFCAKQKSLYESLPVIFGQVYGDKTETEKGKEGEK